MGHPAHFIRTVVASVGLLMAAQAQSAPLIDTGTPTGGVSMANAVDQSNWLAERFTLSSAAVIDQISAYVLSVDSADIGKSFTLAVYGDSPSHLPAMNFNAAAQGQLFQTTITYSADGWNASVSGLNWALDAGAYWFAIEDDASGPGSLLLPTGTVSAAQAVAAYSGGTMYSGTGLSAADTFGLQVTSPVPEPEGLVLATVGLVALALRRRSGSVPGG